MSVDKKILIFIRIYRKTIMDSGGSRNFLRGPEADFLKSDNLFALSLASQYFYPFVLNRRI